MLRRSRMLVRRPDGRFDLRLREDDRLFLAGIAEQMVALLSDRPHDATLRRLSPPAYLDDDDVALEAEYQVFKGGELRDSRLAAFDVLRATAERTDLSEDEVMQWMQAVNSIRLVVGTRLDITDDDEQPILDEDDPERPLWALYDLLSWWLHGAVTALSQHLPPGEDDPPS